MSVFCPKCGKKTFNEYNCDHCGYTIKKRPNINKKWDTKEESIKINKNTLIYTAIIIITLSLAYLAYTKYQERKAIESAVYYITGVEDPNEYLRMNSKDRLKKQMTSPMAKDMYNTIGTSLKQMNKVMEESTNQIKKIKERNKNDMTIINENQRLKRELKKRRINYRTILKQKMHNYKNVYGIEKWKKENKILRRLYQNALNNF